MLRMVSIYFLVFNKYLITQVKNHNIVLLGLCCMYKYIIKYTAKLSKSGEGWVNGIIKKQATKYSLFKIKVFSSK